MLYIKDIKTYSTTSTTSILKSRQIYFKILMMTIINACLAACKPLVNAAGNASSVSAALSMHVVLIVYRKCIFMFNCAQSGAENKKSRWTQNSTEALTLIDKRGEEELPVECGLKCGSVRYCPALSLSLSLSLSLLPGRLSPSHI